MELLLDNLIIHKCDQCATMAVQSYGIYYTSPHDCIDVKKIGRHHVIPLKLLISIVGDRGNVVCKPSSK